VVLHYQVVSLAGMRIGQNELTYGLSARLAPLVPEDVLTLESESTSLEGPATDPGDPVIEIKSSVVPSSVFKGEGSRMFAALTFRYEAWLILPGEPKALLIEEVTVPPPDNLSIHRLTFDKEKPAPLGSSGNPLLDRLEDSRVYTKQAEIAAQAGAVKLAAGLIGP